MGRPNIPNAQGAHLLDPFSIFVPTIEGIEAHEVPLSIPTATIPIMRTSAPREEASIPFLTKSPPEPRRVRPYDFQKWVKKFNRTGDPYHHLANF